MVNFTTPIINQLLDRIVIPAITILEAVVTKEKLHCYDVKTGWGPLCEVLQLPVTYPGSRLPFGNAATSSSLRSRRQRICT